MWVGFKGSGFKGLRFKGSRVQGYNTINIRILLELFISCMSEKRYTGP
jgi:hypothetical protein